MWLPPVPGLSLIRINWLTVLRDNLKPVRNLLNLSKPFPSLESIIKRGLKEVIDSR